LTEKGVEEEEAQVAQDLTDQDLTEEPEDWALAFLFQDHP
jgi:hypothetical protein